MNTLKSPTDRLNDLKLTFDQAIIDGNSFSDVKNIYLQMKEAKKYYDEKMGTGANSPKDDFVLMKAFSEE